MSEFPHMPTRAWACHPSALPRTGPAGLPKLAALFVLSVLLVLLILLSVSKQFPAFSVSAGLGPRRPITRLRPTRPRSTFHGHKVIRIAQPVVDPIIVKPSPATRYLPHFGTSGSLRCSTIVHHGGTQRGQRLQTTDYRLQATDYRLRTYGRAAVRPRAVGPGKGNAYDHGFSESVRISAN